MQTPFSPPRRHQEFTVAAPTRGAEIKQVPAPCTGFVHLAPQGPTAMPFAQPFTPTRAGIPTLEPMPTAVQVAAIPPSQSTGIVSPPVPLPAAAPMVVNVASVPTAAWPSFLPGQAPTRGRQAASVQAQPPAVARQYSGAAPPARPSPSNYQSGAMPPGGAAELKSGRVDKTDPDRVTSAVTTVAAAATASGGVESREVSPQRWQRADNHLSVGTSADDRTSPRKAVPTSHGGSGASPKKEVSRIAARSPSPRRDQEDSVGHGSPHKESVRRSLSSADLKNNDSVKKSSRPAPPRPAPPPGPDEATVVRLLQREVEDLRQENSRLQEKLCKSRSLVLLLQKQSDEARAEKEKEHRRAEGLQTQVNQLNKQLRKEIARGQQMERSMSTVANRSQGRGGVYCTEVGPFSLRGDEDKDSTPLRQRGLSPGRAVPPPVPSGSASNSFAYSNSALPSSLKDNTLDSFGDASLHRMEVHSAEVASEIAVASADADSAQMQEVSFDDGMDELPTDSKMASINPPALGVEQSWEFVVQGQYDSSEQEDFAAKLVSCFPENAVEKAWGCGVAFVCTRGRRMDTAVPNQDDFLVARHTLADEGYIALYGIFDGHGPSGHLCSAFARGSLPESIFGQHTLLMKPEDTLREAFRHTQAALADQPFDTQYSGTTAALALVLKIPNSSEQTETWLFVAHVGDSRIILASHREDEPSAFSVTSLTRDHRPDDAGEAERVQNDGGEVRKLHRSSGTVRVFAPGQDRPALALTRSLGDFAASDCGVIAEPEVSVYRLRPGVDALLMLGTDGLFEFCSNTDAASRILKEGVTAAGLESLCAESRRQWAQSSYNETVDDITAIVATLPTSPSMTPAG